MKRGRTPLTSSDSDDSDASAAAAAARKAQQKAAVLKKTNTLRNKAKKSKKAIFKLAFNSPLVPRAFCKPLNDKDSAIVLDLIKTHVGCIRKRSKEASKGTIPDSGKGKVIVGINNVSRALDVGAASLVVVCGSATPSLLTEHLYSQCQQAKVPLLVIGCSSMQLGQSLGCRLALAFALPTAAQQQARDALVTYAAVPTLPWLDARQTALLPLQVHRQLPNPDREAKAEQ